MPDEDPEKGLIVMSTALETALIIAVTTSVPLGIPKSPLSFPPERELIVSDEASAVEITCHILGNIDVFILPAFLLASLSISIFTFS